MIYKYRIVLCNYKSVFLWLQSNKQMIKIFLEHFFKKEGSNCIYYIKFFLTPARRFAIF